MQYRNLGSSGVKVSSICLGAMTFGQPDENSFMHGVAADENTSFRIMDVAKDSGVNFIDTADVYGQDGLSERVVGRWLKERGARDKMVIATKFRFRMEDGPNGTGASRYRIMKTVESSLKRLGTDRIDLYQIHMQDADVPEDEILRALSDLVQQGKILYLGCSNYTGVRLMESLYTSKEQRLEKFVTLQAQYSLAVRDLERELAPACRKFNLGILPWSPLASGLLSGKYRSHAEQSGRLTSSKWKDTFSRLSTPRTEKILNAVGQVSEALGVTYSQVALSWLLAQPQVSSVIIGARTVAQLEDNLAANALDLPIESLTLLGDASQFELGYPYDFIKRIQGRW